MGVPFERRTRIRCLHFQLVNVRAIIRDVDWLGPMLGRKRGGRNLLPTWVLGDIVYRETQIFR